MLAPLIGIPPKGTEKKQETQEDQFKKLNEKIHITKDASEIAELKVITKTNFLFGGLNLIYGKDGSGKSWQTSTAIKNSNCNNFYLDTDGSNGQAFAAHCINNDVFYITADDIDNFLKPGSVLNLWDKTQEIIKFISETMTLKKNIFIIDSLTSIAEGAGINNAEEISDPLYKLNKLGAKYNIAILLIDHATVGVQHNEGFKLEGNAGAKSRTTVTVNRYTPVDPKHPEKGGVFTCERARGNSSGLKINDKQIITSKNLNDAIEFMLKKCPEIKTVGITKSISSTVTNKDYEAWVKEHFETMFDYTKKGRATILTLKKKYITKDEC